jgi:hypothetical protein
MGYAVTFAGIPVALWTGAVDAVQRQLDLLAAHAVGNNRLEDWRICYGRALKLRDGNEGHGLIASFIEARADPNFAPPFRDLAIEASIPVPSPSDEAHQVPWSSPELLRVDALLRLWHDVPGAVAAAEAKLLRAIEITREQAALSWELRAAMSLAHLWHPRGRRADARDLVIATYEKFTEGFATSDLVQARILMAEL